MPQLFWTSVHTWRLTEHHFFGSSYGVNSCNKEQKRLALCVLTLAAFWVPM